MVGTTLSRTEAFLFAIKKSLEARKDIDGTDVNHMQIIVSMNREGHANVSISCRTETVVSHCLQGYARHDRYDFSDKT